MGRQRRWRRADSLQAKDIHKTVGRGRTAVPASRTRKGCAAAHGEIACEEAGQSRRVLQPVALRQRERADADRAGGGDRLACASAQRKAAGARIDAGVQRDRA